MAEAKQAARKANRATADARGESLSAFKKSTLWSGEGWVFAGRSGFTN